MNNKLKEAKTWYDRDYLSQGFKAQRNYPNEELLRFMGRNFFSKEEKSKIKILETGCGSCANLWMIAKEGFDAYGLDLSSESLKLGKMRLDHWNVNAHLTEASMTAMPFENDYFDSIADVFSSNCLDMQDFEKYIGQCSLKLKKGGKLFSYTPGSSSAAFHDFAPAEKIDEFTLNGIYRKNSPFYGNYYPFRFSTKEWLEEILLKNNFAITYFESLTRTYNDQAEQFEFLVYEAVKK